VARNRGAAAAAPASGDSLATQRMRIPTNGPHDGDTLSPEITPAPGTVDFGAVRVPVPAGGTVSVEPSTAGRIQAVHVTVPEGRLSVSALAAPRTGGLWTDLATEIDASLREGGARVRSFTGEWGRELHATTGGATSVFVGVDGPRWMLYGVATGPTRDAVGLDARLRRMLRGTVVVRGKAPFPVRTVLPLVTPSESGSEEQAAAAPPTMTLRAPAAAAMGDAPKALTAGSDAAVPAPLAASVNGAVNGSTNGSTNGAVNGAAVNGAAANGAAVNGAASDDATGVFRRNGASQAGGTRPDGSTTGATRKDVPARGPSTTGGSRTGGSVPGPAARPRGGSPSRRRQGAANGTGASVPFPPTTNGAKRSSGTTGATPLGPAAAVNRPGGATGAHPLGHTGATPLGPAAAVNRPGGATGAHPLGLNGVSRAAGTTGANRLGNAPGAGLPGYVTGANPIGANRPDGATGAHPLGRGGVSRSGATGTDRLGPAAADFVGGNTGAHPAGPPTGDYRVGADDEPSPTRATWSGAYPPLSTGAAPGTSPYGLPSAGAPQHHPASGRSDGSATPPWSSSSIPLRPTGSFPTTDPTPPDVASWPAGPPSMPSLGSARPEVPAAWAHESGGDRRAAGGFSLDDLVGGRPEPVSAPWEPAPPVAPSYSPEPEAARTPPFEPRSADRYPPPAAPSVRGVAGQWDPLVDPLPMALDPLPAPSQTWTDDSSNGRYDAATDDQAAPPRRRSRDDAAGSTNGAAAPRWRAADLLRDRNGSDAAGNGSSGRWRAADLLAGRDDKHEADGTGARKWLAADLLADRNGSDATRSPFGRSRTSGDASTATSRRGNDRDATASRRGGDAATTGGHGIGGDRAAASWLDDSGAEDAAAPRRRRGGEDSAASGWRGEDSVAPSRRDDAAGHGADASRWRAADLLASEPHADSRARRRRDADSTADRPVNGHAGASHDANGVGPRWRAADLLVDAAAAEDHVPTEPPAPPRRGRNGEHDRDGSTTSTWQAAELLNAPADPAEPDRPSRWRAAASESGGSGHTGAKWLAADLLDQRHQSDEDDSGRRHDPAPTHADAALPSRVPPTQWAWPKEPEADPLPPRRAESAGPSAWAAADLLDQGRHTGGRRRARETTRHGKPDDEDAGRHYRP